MNLKYLIISDSNITLNLSPSTQVLSARLALAEIPSMEINGVILDSTKINHETSFKLIQKLKLRHPSIPYSLIYSRDQSHSLLDWILTLQPLEIAMNLHPETMELLFHNLVEHCQNQHQEAEYDQLLQLEKARFKQNNIELQNQIEKKTKWLSQHVFQFEQRQFHFNLIKTISLIIYRAESIEDLEHELKIALTDQMALQDLKINIFEDLHLPPSFKSEITLHSFKTALNFSEGRQGEFSLATQPQHALSTVDAELLERISEIIAIGVDRILKFEQTKILKNQWQATFDAISDPLCITDTEFKILKFNKAFLRKTLKTVGDILGQHCFQVFLKDKSPQFDSSIINSRLEANKTRITLKADTSQSENPSYEIRWHPFELPHSKEQLFLIFIKDITDQIQKEKILNESSKLSELGLIGSSIAHELNNPIGGIYSFLQLIQMDVKNQPELSDDIEEMLRAARKSRDIVQSLLGFARKESNAEAHPFILIEVLERSAEIAKQRAEGMGMSIQTRLENSNIMLQGHPERLQLALQSVFTTALNQAQNVSAPQIEIRSFKSATHITIEIKTENINEITPMQNTSTDSIQRKVQTTSLDLDRLEEESLTLSLAKKIIDEHYGRLEFFSQSNGSTLVKMEFPSQTSV